MVLDHYYNKKTKRRIKGIITVDVYWFSVILRNYKKNINFIILKIIQDCCDALGTFYIQSC